MATSEKIILTEHLYSGGTVAVPEGTELTPEQAYALGVTEDGKLDRLLSTDDLRQRSASLSTPVAVGHGTADHDAGGDDELASANADQVISYLHANPTEVDRVAAAEESRSGGSRKTVMEAVGRLRSGG